MAIISHHLQSVVRAARIAAWASAFGFVVVSVLMLIGFNKTGEGRTAHSVRLEILLLCISAALFLVPAAVMWFLADRLEDGRDWAFVLILLLALIEVPKLIFSGIACLWIPLGIPALYLGACCLNAIPDARDLYRERRRARRPRGFEPILSGPRPVRPPPRAARPVRPPRPGSRSTQSPNGPMEANDS